MLTPLVLQAGNGKKRGKGDATLLFFILRLSWSTLWAIFQLATRYFTQPLDKTRITAGQPFFYILPQCLNSQRFIPLG